MKGEKACGRTATIHQFSFVSGWPHHPVMLKLCDNHTTAKNNNKQSQFSQLHKWSTCTIVKTDHPKRSNSLLCLPVWSRKINPIAGFPQLCSCGGPTVFEWPAWAVAQTNYQMVRLCNCASGPKFFTFEALAALFLRQQQSEYTAFMKWRCCVFETVKEVVQVYFVEYPPLSAMVSFKVASRRRLNYFSR